MFQSVHKFSYKFALTHFDHSVIDIHVDSNHRVDFGIQFLIDFETTENGFSHCFDFSVYYAF